MAAAIGAAIHGGILVAFVARFGWPKPPLDIWRLLSFGLIAGAFAGFSATIVASAIYGRFEGMGPEWAGALAGAICAAFTTVQVLKRSMRTLADERATSV